MRHGARVSRRCRGQAGFLDGGTVPLKERLSELAGQAAPAATKSDGNTLKAAGRAKRTPAYPAARSSGERTPDPSSTDPILTATFRDRSLRVAVNGPSQDLPRLPSSEGWTRRSGGRPARGQHRRSQASVPGSRRARTTCTRRAREDHRPDSDLRWWALGKTLTCSDAKSGRRESNSRSQLGKLMFCR